MQTAIFGEQGSVRRSLIQYSLPLIAANLLQSVYGLTDMCLAGMFIGSGGISAINNAGQVMMLYTGIMVGLANGGNVMIGQYFGKGAKEKYTACAGCFLTLFALLGAFFSVALTMVSKPLMTFMGAPALADAVSYLALCAPGAFAIAGYNAAAAVFRGLGISKKPLLFVGVSVGANILLDMLFMGGLSMGVAGAALATALSQYLSLLLSLYFLYLERNRPLTPRRTDFQLEKKSVRQILSVGFPCAVQMTVASLSWLSVTFLLNGYGVAVSAANGVSTKIKDVVQTVTAAVSMAATSMIAQALGAKKYDDALQIMYAAMQLAVLSSLVLIVIVELFAPTLVAFFDKTPAVILAGTRNLRIEILAQISYAVFLIYHALMTGAGHTRLVLCSSFVNCILVRAILAVLLNGTMGAAGVYISCAIAPAASIPIGMLYVKQGRWRRSLIE